MQNFRVDVQLKYEGELAENGQLDFYDAAQALLGFQRSIALTTHFVINGKVITQAPSLKGAEIIIQPPKKGSWIVVATVLGGLGYLGTRPKDTPIGHIVTSAYDYVLRRTMGIKVDFDKTIGELLDDKKQRDGILLSEGRFDDLAEKCEYAIKEMHRPVVHSQTAERGRLSRIERGQIVPLKTRLTEQTYEALDFERKSNVCRIYEGLVSGYNVNTKKGRFYIKELSRTVPFIIADSYAAPAVASRIARNMERLASGDLNATLKFEAFENQSRNGRLRSLIVVQIKD